MTTAPSPEVEASRILVDMWRPIAGRHFPVDPIRIARQLGISVYRVALNPGTAGALIKEPDRDVVILLNETDSKNRQRFTCAHELGHYVHRETTLKNSYSFVDERSYLASEGTDPVEIFANGFAANLLMPKDEVTRLYNKGTPPYEMASHFGVSGDALGVRLRALRLS